MGSQKKLRSNDKNRLSEEEIEKMLKDAEARAGGGSTSMTSTIMGTTMDDPEDDDEYDHGYLSELHIEGLGSAEASSMAMPEIMELGSLSKKLFKSISAEL